MAGGKRRASLTKSLQRDKAIGSATLNSEVVMSGSVKAEVRTYRNYVNGQWLASASGETFPVYDPSTEEVIARVSAAGKADVDVAVKAARDAFDSGPWAKTTAQDRGRILL